MSVKLKYFLLFIFDMIIAGFNLFLVVSHISVIPTLNLTAAIVSTIVGMVMLFKLLKEF